MVIVSALVAWTIPARAADAGDFLQLRWSAPAGCPGAEAVRAATLRDIGATKGEVLEADARVEQAPPSGSAPGVWRVRLRTKRGTSTGEREIEAASCAGLVEATGVLLGLALVTSESEVPAGDPPPASLPETETKHEVDRAPARPSKETHALAIGAAFAADASSLPRAAVGGSLTLAWTPSRLRIELDARRWGSQSGSVGGGGSGARFTMTSLGGRGCFAALKTGSFDLSPCVGGDAHLVSAPGYGADTNYSATAEWATFAGGGLGRLAFTSWLSARARAEVVVPFSRPTFIVENEGAVHRPAAIGAAGSIGVEANFL